MNLRIPEDATLVWGAINELKTKNQLSKLSTSDLKVVASALKTLIRGEKLTESVKGRVLDIASDSDEGSSSDSSLGKTVSGFDNVFRPGHQEEAKEKILGKIANRLEIVNNAQLAKVLETNLTKPIFSTNSFYTLDVVEQKNVMKKRIQQLNHLPDSERNPYEEYMSLLRGSPPKTEEEKKKFQKIESALPMFRSADKENIAFNIVETTIKGLKFGGRNALKTLNLDRSATPDEEMLGELKTLQKDLQTFERGLEKMAPQEKKETLENLLESYKHAEISLEPFAGNPQIASTFSGVLKAEARLISLASKEDGSKTTDMKAQVATLVERAAVWDRYVAFSRE